MQKSTTPPVSAEQPEPGKVMTVAQIDRPRGAASTRTGVRAGGSTISKKLHDITM